MKVKLNLIAGTQIKSIRNSKNYTLDYVAFKIGIHKSKLCKIENGQQLVDVHTVFLLCNFYEVSIGTFMTSVENEYIKKYPPHLGLNKYCMLSAIVPGTQTN